MSAPPPPPAPAPTPGHQMAPQPRPRRRRTWVVVLVAVMVAILAVAGAGTALFISNTLPAFSAADDFMEDLVEARFDAAADQLCTSASGRAEAAILSVTENFIGGENLSVNPFTVDRDGDRATVEYTVRPRGGGEDDIYVLPLRRERGDWRPCPAAGR